jgi:hypothetical protein
MCASRSAIRSSLTCFVNPSLHSRCTLSHSARSRVTTGSAVSAPSALESTCANCVCGAWARERIPWSTRSFASVWSRVTCVSRPSRHR